MIVIPYTFRTVLTKCGDDTLRVCTGQRVNPYRANIDDWVLPSDVDLPEGTLLVYSLKDVKRAVRGRLIANALLAVAFFVALCINLWMVYCQSFLNGRWTLSWHLFFAGLAAMFFVVLVRQGVRPIVHDEGGNWVNLRTGSSSLCGGIVIKKECPVDVTHE